MDEFAVGSVEKALAAIDAGKFKEQIVPMEVPTPKGTITFDVDEGPRRGTTLEGLAKLRPAFAPSPKLGACTAGNSSQMSDGGAAVVLMSEEAVKETGAKPMAKVLGYKAAADSPRYLGPAQLEAHSQGPRTLRDQTRRRGPDRETTRPSHLSACWSAATSSST